MSSRSSLEAKRIAEEVITYLDPLLKQFPVEYLIMTIRILNTRQMLFLEVPEVDVRFEPIDLVLGRFLSCTEEIIYRDGSMEDEALREVLLHLIDIARKSYGFRD